MIHEPMGSDQIEILLVEDNEDDIILIEEAFTEAKWMNLIFKVRDGEGALAYLRKQGPYANMRRPGLVLLDINMPRKNGFEVLQAMKADPLLDALPVVMLTTSDREEDIIRSYTHGASSYIRKPVRLEQFIQVVKNFEVYWTMVSLVPSTKR